MGARPEPGEAVTRPPVAEVVRPVEVRGEREDWSVSEQERLIEWLKGKKEVQLKGPNIDMKMSIATRRFINSSGENNMPSGEIFTSPMEDSATGWVKYTYPAITGGRPASTTMDASSMPAGTISIVTTCRS